jgi:hypothetical protein
MRFRRPILALAATLAVATIAAPVRADPTADQLKAQYEETVRQLQQSQDRKNQLANENEQLKAHVAELEGKLNAIDAQAKQAEFLRGQYVAWQTFIERYPQLLNRFQIFTGIGTPPAVVATPEPFFDPEWPFSAAARVEEASAAPAASTAAVSAMVPTTMPALVQMFHGGPNHWCALCAAAAQRKAESDANKSSAGDAIAPPPTDDLMSDLPPR